MRSQHRIIYQGLEKGRFWQYNWGMSLSSTTPTSPVQAPQFYRIMRRDPGDDLPVTGTTSSSELGVRPGLDVDLDANGEVVLNSKGMSVAPAWRDIDFTRIPKRLRPFVPGATGSNSNYCFTMGRGPFQRDPVANGLELIPDQGQPPIKHGNVAPSQSASLAQYQAVLGSTRSLWKIDET